MATYGTKYYYYYTDIYTNETWQVQLMLKDYAGASFTIPSAARDTEVIKDRGQDPHNRKKQIIIGTEVEFNFTVLEEDSHKYDEIGESIYKDWILFRRKQFGDFQFEGYVKPEHFKRTYIENGNYIITIAATDGLGDLKGIEYLDTNGDQYSDRATGLTIIKRCLEAGELPELDFKIQLNTYEHNLMAADELALAVVEYDNRRFYKTSAGRTVPLKCHEVLEWVCKIFHVWIRQIDNYYYIVNSREPNSYIYEYDYITLTLQSRTASNLVVDLTSGYNFSTRGVKSYAAPLNRFEVEFQNKNWGEDESINGNFDDPDISFWNNENWEEYSRVVSLPGGNGYLEVGILENPALDTRHFYTDSISIGTYSSGDLFKVTYKVRINTIEFNSSTGAVFPEIYTGFQKVGGTVIQGTKRTVYSVEDNWIEFTDYYSIADVGDYVVYFYVDIQDEIFSLVYDYDDIELTQERQADEITFDKIVGIYNLEPAFEEDREIIKFGDSQQNSDIGALKIGTDLTSTWRRYGTAESLPLYHIYGIQILSDYQTYSVSLSSLVVIDEFDVIRPYNILTLPDLTGVSGSDKNFEIVSYKRQVRDARVTLILKEIHETDADFGVSEQALTSVDGELSSWSAVNSYINNNSSFWYRKEDGNIFSNARVGMGFGTLTGNYELEVLGDGSISNDLTVGNDLEVTGTINAGTALEVGGVNISTIYEPVLGNPVTSGYVLSSTDAGVRSWVSNEATQWVTTGSDIYYNTGNVGIGTTTPSATLHVESPTAGQEAIFGDGTFIDHYITLRNNVSLGVNIGLDSSGNAGNGSFLLQAGGSKSIDFATDVSGAFGSGTPSMSISTAGNVGIGIITPGEKLEVIGNISLTENIKMSSGTPAIQFGSSIYWQRDGTSSMSLGVWNVGNGDHELFVTSGTGDLAIKGVITEAGTLLSNKYEAALGNPVTSGYILSSTDAGVRSWVASPVGSTLQTVTDNGSTTTNDISITDTLTYLNSSTIVYGDPTDLGGGVGSLAIDGGANGGFEGYSIGGYSAFVRETSSGDTGIYDDAYSNWIIKSAGGGGVELNYNGSKRLETTNGGVTIQTVLLVSGYVTINSANPTSGVPPLYINQGDVSEEMLEFATTIGTGNAIEAVGSKTLTVTHYIKVTIPGPLTRYIPCGTIA